MTFIMPESPGQVGVNQFATAGLGDGCSSLRLTACHWQLSSAAAIVLSALGGSGVLESWLTWPVERCTCNEVLSDLHVGILDNLRLGSMLIL